ncbi:MAG: hypothetical protein AB7N24_14905 [Dehalococcoidia bacterium]
MATAIQEPITVIAPVEAGALERLNATIAGMSSDVANGALPFGKIEGLHFARLVIIPPESDGDAHQLMLLLDCDAPGRTRLRRLVSLGGEGLDGVFGLCEGYPGEGDRNSSSRYAYLRDHRISTAATYVNTVGRTVEQILKEATLRDEIERFLDSGNGWAAKPAVEVRAAIQGFVKERADLNWALEPAPTLSLLERLKTKANLAGGIALGVVLAPVAVVGAIPFIIQLRRLERSDPAPRVVVDEAHARELAEIEDLVHQNQFTAFGPIKPGRFRRYLAIGLLWAVNFGARHRFNNGNLAGVKTIHAARWIFIDDKRRVVFCSNYDGSLENYMDDFIDKVAWGLNAVFSNGVGYPKTSWLIKGGAKDEQAFKSYIRAHQVPSPVWYTAYPNLTAVNIGNNAKIRAGLSGEMDEAAALEWLRRF